MWNKKRSLLLSKITVILFIAVATAIIIPAPLTARFLIDNSNTAGANIFPLLLATLYVGYIIAIILLTHLYLLLNNISHGEIFTIKNVKYLRIISWLCILGGGIALISSLYWVLWLLFAIPAAFIGLIVRIIKNIVAEAVFIKEENDFTI